MLNELPSLDEQQDSQTYPPTRIPAGLVVFSPTLHMLYQNHQAKHLSTLIKGECLGSLLPLTKAFHDISGEILERLRQHHRQSHTQLLEKKCVMIIDPFTILFQGIGIRNNQNFSESRIMIRFTIRKEESNRIGS